MIMTFLQRSFCNDAIFFTSHQGAICSFSLPTPHVFTKSDLQNHDFIFNQLNDFDENKIKLQVVNKENGSNWLKL